MRCSRPYFAGLNRFAGFISFCLGSASQPEESLKRYRLEGFHPSPAECAFDTPTCAD
jgi:hypothetical protein